MKTRAWNLPVLIPLLSGCIPFRQDMVLHNRSGKTVSVYAPSLTEFHEVDPAVQDGTRVCIPTGTYGELIELRTGTNIYLYPPFSLIPCEGRSEGLCTTVYDFTLLPDMTIVPAKGVSEEGAVPVPPNRWRPHFWLRVDRRCSTLGGLPAQTREDLSHFLTVFGDRGRVLLECDSETPLGDLAELQDDLAAMGAAEVLTVERTSNRESSGRIVLRLRFGRNPRNAGGKLQCIFLNRAPEAGLPPAAGPPARISAADASAQSLEETQFLLGPELTVGELFGQVHACFPNDLRPAVTLATLNDPFHQMESESFVSAWLLCQGENDFHDPTLDAIQTSGKHLP